MAIVVKWYKAVLSKERYEPVLMDEDRPVPEDQDESGNEDVNEKNEELFASGQ